MMSLATLRLHVGARFTKSMVLNRHEYLVENVGKTLTDKDVETFLRQQRVVE